MKPRSPSLCFAMALLAAMQPPWQSGAAKLPPDSRIGLPRFSDHVAEAAARTALPESWIWAVMGQESRRDPNAISPAGAMGLMQIMPATWRVLRARYGLGSDPFDPHDNVMAGAAYLREMLDRYGAAGMLAAYNAGPGRYEQWLRIGRPLPTETRDYVAKLSAHIVAGVQAASSASVPDWRRSMLFASGSTTASRSSAAQAESASSSTPPPLPDRFQSGTDLFVDLGGGQR